MNYNIFTHFLFRTSLLPFNELKCYSENNLIKDINKLIQESIFLASPILYKEIEKLNKHQTTDPREIDRIKYSKHRYISRMSTRCTPFGLFAGCGMGEIGENTGIILEKEIGRVTRLDMLFLCTLFDYLIKIPEIKENIKYFTNTSLYPIGKKYRYIEILNASKLIRKYQITAVDQTSYFDKVVRAASKGITIKELINILVTDEVEEEDVKSYIDELISSQIIVGEQFQAISGDDYLTRIIRLIAPMIPNSPLLNILQQVQEQLNLIDNKRVNDISSYQKIITEIEKLNIPIDEKYLFQVDSTRKCESASIGSEIVQELNSSMIFLNKITTFAPNETLNQFKKKFSELYEEMEVPLMEALDPESGLGYPLNNNGRDISPLIDNLFLPSNQGDGTSSLNLNPFHNLLYKRTIECLAAKKNIIQFTDNDVKGFRENWNDLPPTLYSTLSVIRANGMGDVLISLKYFGGISAANLLARFSHTDPKIEQFVKSITQKDQELIPDKILADIVHLPEARTGNVVSRPHLRDYELLYMTCSDLSDEQLIDINDLLLSVKQGRLVIRSKRLNKEIIPRLTNAHNYRLSAMPVYRFLCDMQTQERGGVVFNWGGGKVSICTSAQSTI